MKVKYKDVKAKGNEYAAKVRSFYETKYFSLYINSFKFTGIDKKKARYLLKKAWKFGTWASFIVDGTKPDASLEDVLSNKTASSLSVGKENENGLLVLCSYGATQYDAEDEPSVVTLINSRGATFIPTTPQIVNKDVVIGWAHSSHMPVHDLVEFYINKLVEVEVALDMNVYAHKMPRLVVCSPEDRARVEALVEKIEDGEHNLFLDVTDWQAIKNILDSGGNFIIDKLKIYLQNIENDLLTFLGVNNVSINKQERLITDEAEANDQLINDSSDCFLDALQEYCDNVSDVLGYPISVEAQSSPASNQQITTKEDETMEDNEYENSRV